MTIEQFNRLQVGDIVRHKNSGNSIVIVNRGMDSNGSYFYSAVDYYTVSNPEEWEYFDKKDYTPLKSKEVRLGFEFIFCQTEMWIPVEDLVSIVPCPSNPKLCTIYARQGGYYSNVECCTIVSRYEDKKV